MPIELAIGAHRTAGDGRDIGLGGILAMIELRASLGAWGTDAFPSTLKREIEALPAGSLPLDRAACHGGRVDDGPVVATVIGAVDAGTHLEARVGVFFGEVIAGCSCGDEPFTQPGYCEIEVCIDKTTAAAGFALIPA
jgi:hypothetical protein